MMFYKILQMVYTNIQTIILGITAGVVFWYTKETQKLREETEQANMFATLTKIQERMTNRKSYEIRGYINTSFTEHLAEVTLGLFGNDFIIKEKGIKKVNVSAVLDNLEKIKMTYRNLIQD